MDSPLDGCLKKIDRSLEHFGTLNRSGKAIFEEDFYGIFRLHGETNSQRTKLFFRAELLRDLPLVEWGIIVGDAVHCLRSALDQLVYAVSVSPDGNTQYPLMRTEKDWVTKAPAMLWGVPEPFVALIHATQPYHRGDAAHSHELAVLGELSNCDKHRAIPVTALVPEDGEWNITSTQGITNDPVIRLKRGSSLENGAILAETKIVTDESGLDPQVQMDGHFSFAISFGKTALVPSSIQGKPVIKTFRDLGGYATSVILDANALLRGEPLPL